jgi:hypothetical protein
MLVFLNALNIIKDNNAAGIEAATVRANFKPIYRLDIVNIAARITPTNTAFTVTSGKDICPFIYGTFCSDSEPGIISYYLLI